jgi:large subunit ribosomal protein L12
MKYVYAALLLHSAAKPINEENIKKVLSASGVNIDESRVKALVAALSEINIDEVLKAASTAAAVPAAAPSPSPSPTEAKKEEKPEKEEKKEEEALAGLGALFG